MRSRHDGQWLCPVPASSSMVLALEYIMNSHSVDIRRKVLQMVGRFFKPDNQIFISLVWKQTKIDCLPRYSAVESGLGALYRLTTKNDAPKETAIGRVAIFPCIVVALVGLEKIAFAVC